MVKQKEEERRKLEEEMVRKKGELVVSQKSEEMNEGEGEGMSTLASSNQNLQQESDIQEEVKKRRLDPVPSRRVESREEERKSYLVLKNLILQLWLRQKEEGKSQEIGLMMQVNEEEALSLFELDQSR